MAETCAQAWQQSSLAWLIQKEGYGASSCCSQIGWDPHDCYRSWDLTQHTGPEGWLERERRKPVPGLGFCFLCYAI